MSTHIILTRTEHGPQANIEQTITHHPPTGFEWGYEGSGPADLALNILQQNLERQDFIDVRIPLWHGRCFGLAWQLHQEFKRKFIAVLPHEGGQIAWADVDQWLQEQIEKMYLSDELGSSR